MVVVVWGPSLNQGHIWRVEQDRGRNLVHSSAPPPSARISPGDKETRYVKKSHVKFLESSKNLAGHPDEHVGVSLRGVRQRSGEGVVQRKCLSKRLFLESLFLLCSLKVFMCFKSKP